jgi:hypothetical protein
MKKIIIVFIFAIGFISCSSNEETKIDNSDLIGKWNWISTDGGLAFNIHETPTSTGNTFQLSLMKNYLYSIAKNGNEVSSGKYELVMKKSIYSGEMERFIIYSESENQQLQNIAISGIIKVYETNKLGISDNNYDGIGSGFVKTE